MWPDPARYLRLCRPMCGKSLTFRSRPSVLMGATPRRGHSPQLMGKGLLAERLSHPAHQAEQPQALNTQLY